MEINGIVQGVGFRPFIHKIVKENSLAGWVKNSTRGVEIEVEGRQEDLQEFILSIKEKKPKLSVIENINIVRYNELKNYRGFEIIKSTDCEEGFTLISPDVCICDDCLGELFNKEDRRYKYPFINCTNCGPRFTIIKDTPYDRDKTTMGSFPMCSSCSDEYGDINNRRYHAQPDCCFDCGPSVKFTDNMGCETGKDPFKAAGEYINDGKIIAVKGLGGFHLACDASNNEAVMELRKRKHRDEKPFAIMCRDIETIERLCFVSEEEKRLLESFRRPIVLLKKRSVDCLKGVAPDNSCLGVMLPYTPVHYLLMKESVDTLVMTSANISDIPAVYKNDDAVEKLGNIAHGFLLNNRDIHVRCDDSLYRIFEGREYPIRRSRGYVPFPIKSHIKLGEILACGAEQKASFSLTKGKYIFQSQHIGDMKNLETLEHYEKQIEHFINLFGIEPEKIACDMHPDYMSTDFAVNMAEKKKIPIHYIQHHHAHMAACMGDNNLSQRVIGIIWDGTGYGLDGSIWGGEFLTGDYRGFERAGTIEKIALPGGDKAVRDIHRIKDAILYKTFNEETENIPLTHNLVTIKEMIDKNINTPYASSIGRLFDGVASILGIRDRVSYEGQGAIMLEGIALETEESYEYAVNKGSLLVFDWRPLIAGIIRDMEQNTDKGVIAAKFMNTLINGAVDITIEIRNRTGLRDVVLSGGVFQNIYVLGGLKKKLLENNFNVFVHSRIACNDEGISLGQALIAANGGDADVSGCTA